MNFCSTPIRSQVTGGPGGRARRVVRRGFTLVELLVAIGIIILLLTMAMPAFNLMTGARSEESAMNLLSSMFTHARAEAIGLQQKRGIVVGRDADTGQYVAWHVEVPDEAWVSTQAYVAGEVVVHRDGHWLCVTGNTGSEPSLGNNRWQPCVTPVRRLPDSERSLLPKAVGLFSVGTLTTSSLPNADRPFLVLFGADGSLVGTRYFIMNDADLNATTLRNYPAFTVTDYTRRLPVPNPLPAFALSVHAFGAFELELYDQAAQSGGGVAWLQGNAEVRMINRYNGTVMNKTP